jgi:hypothetical protein
MFHVNLCYKIRIEVAKLPPQTRSPPLHAVVDANPAELRGVGWPGPGQPGSGPGPGRAGGQPSDLNYEAAHLPNLADTDMAEKFAKELLWIAKKLLACGGMEEAVQQWSSAASLAELSLYASPKVPLQQCIST